jgi:putative ATPase
MPDFLVDEIIYMSNLFSATPHSHLTPLAERCRPQTLEQYQGQKHLLGKGKIISAMLTSGTPFSMILWGGPGTGKTTLAHLIAAQLNMETHFLSAISAGVADVRKVIAQGKQNKAMGVHTLLFLDEIHRFNKAQQDAVLGAVESGDITLIGATTENPSFSVIAPLLSRTRVLKLYPLDEDVLCSILKNALRHDEVLKKKELQLVEGAMDKVVQLAQGDARRMLNLIELAASITGTSTITDETIKEALKDMSVYYDKLGDRHYDTISAFIKSMRGSDPNAAVYYLARMLEGGEDPVFIARRMIIFSSEDIGNAHPQALPLAVAALTATQNIGLPEARIILSQCAIFLASAPKSNASYLAINEAQALARDFSLEIPLHLRNAPTKMMSEMGYGKEYQYPHDFPGHFVKETYLPQKLQNKILYKPTRNGSEKSISERLEKLWPDKYSKDAGSKK